MTALALLAFLAFLIAWHWPGPSARRRVVDGCRVLASGVIAGVHAFRGRFR